MEMKYEVIFSFEINKLRKGECELSTLTNELNLYAEFEAQYFGISNDLRFFWLGSKYTK